MQNSLIYQRLKWKDQQQNCYVIRGWVQSKIY